MASRLIPSEIIRLSAEINQRVLSGESIFNLTIGDFDPGIFPLPKDLYKAIGRAYDEGMTNYPPANGVLLLRKALSAHIERRMGLSTDPEDILVSGGARPLIYSLYKTVVDPGDIVVYPVPSWNNNHYCHLCGAEGISVETKASEEFMPQAESLRPHLEKASLLALCSPQNPTGTVFSKENLHAICKLVLEENRIREGTRKPLYVMYDQIYQELCMPGTVHEHPVNLEPAMRDYVVTIDGMSKAFAATGIRVGWAYGPREVLSKMRAILSHVGAWAPKPEQMASAWFLQSISPVDDYLEWFRAAVGRRLHGLYADIRALNQSGYPIDAIQPKAAIYLTVQIPWQGRSAGNRRLDQVSDVADYLIGQCKIGLVPFRAFGAPDAGGWHRISVGTLRENDIPLVAQALKRGMDQFGD
ncbi:MAG: pyridoxal phosphate-dependent aminotransferase [Saprospiraceae bacterium]|nr:pyridoxal phosphate-dependent aminotransferase [Saprospiraceae bacterium]MBP9210427.1 pyridoxal phosphate-dependent aminotransferase [Saprospiraceae bacterium]